MLILATVKSQRFVFFGSSPSDLTPCPVEPACRYQGTGFCSVTGHRRLQCWTGLQRGVGVKPTSNEDFTSLSRWPLCLRFERSAVEASPDGSKPGTERWPTRLHRTRPGML